MFTPGVRQLIHVARPYSSAAPASAAARVARATRWRRVGLYGAAGTATLMGFMIAQLYISTSRASSHAAAATAGDGSPGPRTQDELTRIYDATADGFDAEVNISERLMGVTRARRKMAARARGHVLEVSCGTARNLGYYRFDAREEGEGVRSLTLADLSYEMVEVGKRKWFALRISKALAGDVKGVPVRFWHGNVKGEMPPPPKDAATGGVSKGYDTIVQSMGLCSTDEPVELLQNLASYLNEDNAEAKILLLEHGRSYIEWWNSVLDSQAATHASKHGCWWNRDIGSIVAQSGLEVVKERRQNFGTTWIYELKKKAGTSKKESSGNANTDEGPISIATASEGKSWGDWLPRWTYEKICKR